ncbi:unnamed protein product [Cunninghamella blakesleeana]
MDKLNDENSKNNYFKREEIYDDIDIDKLDTNLLHCLIQYRIRELKKQQLQLKQQSYILNINEALFSFKLKSLELYNCKIWIENGLYELLIQYYFSISRLYGLLTFDKFKCLSVLTIHENLTDDKRTLINENLGEGTYNTFSLYIECKYVEELVFH